MTIHTDAVDVQSRSGSPSTRTHLDRSNPPPPRCPNVVENPKSFKLDDVDFARDFESGLIVRILQCMNAIAYKVCGVIASANKTEQTFHLFGQL